ncbi:MAG: DUF4080 domain-containing protein [Clostridiales bacterium]|nr:DUF4080 domain-containing protein [Clostridiales bacterium]
MKKLRASMVCINSKYIHSSLAPWCLLAGIKKYGDKNIIGTVVEGTINEDISQIVQRVSDTAPDVVGLSCYIWNIKRVHKLVAMLKQLNPKLIVILGGPEVSYNARETLENYTNVDFIISGEGELPMALTLNSILNSGDYDIDGLCYRENSEIIVSEPFVSKEEPPTPYCQEYFDSLKGRIAYLETSRGCPYSCAFCLSGRCGNARFFDVQRAKDEIIMLANSGTKTIKLVDRTFNANKKRATEIVQFIAESYGKAIPKGVCIHFEIAGDILDERLLDSFKRLPVGAVQLEIGMQSFNEKTLEYINRKTNTEVLKKNIKTLISFGNMHIHIDLIAGLPFEDISSIKNSFNIGFELKPHMLQFGFLKLLYGADMRENTEKYPCEYSQEPPYEIISNQWLTSQELKNLHYFEDALDRLYNSGRFKRTLNYILSTVNLKAFDVFYDFGMYSKNNVRKNIPLSDYIEKVYGYFSEVLNINRDILRDMLVCDRLAIDSSGIIPKALQRDNYKIKAARKLLNSNASTMPKENIRRTIEVLVSQNKIIYTDYDEKNPVTGEYIINFIDN